jgi:hypothetical protein
MGGKRLKKVKSIWPRGPIRHPYPSFLPLAAVADLRSDAFLAALTPFGGYCPLLNNL